MKRARAFKFESIILPQKQNITYHYFTLVFFADNNGETIDIDLNQFGRGTIPFAPTLILNKNLEMFQVGVIGTHLGHLVDTGAMELVPYAIKGQEMGVA